MAAGEKVLIACALKKEARALREHLSAERSLFATGLGTDRTLRSLERQFDRSRPDLVVFTGMAGQLDPSLELGDLVIPERWRFESGDEFPVVDPLIRGLRERGWPVQGSGVTVRVPIVRQSHRLEVFQQTGARVCDMESAAVLMICKSFGIQCISAKIISDTADSGMLAFYRNFQRNVEILGEKIEQLVEDAGSLLAQTGGVERI